MNLDEEKIVDSDAGGADTAPIERAERPERAERSTDRDPQTREAISKKKDVRSTIRSAMKEFTAQSPVAKPVVKADTQTPVVESSIVDSNKEVSETAKEATPKVASVAAPASLSKETRAVWDTLPDIVKNDIIKRESDTAKGVEQLKAKYKPYDDVFAPYQAQLQQIGKTPVEAAAQLLNWQNALANPRTQREAFAALARAHNFDLSTLAAPQGERVANPDGLPPQIDIRSHLDPIANEVNNLKSYFERERADKVNNDIQSFAKDKPHFEKVRVTMGHLINAGIAQGDNPQAVFNDAYEKACRADGEVFSMIQQEEIEKRETEAKAKAEAAAKKAADDAEAKRKADAEAVEKARRAGVNRNQGSPQDLALASRQKRGQSVGDALREAIKSSGASI